ncbi:MAG TPA: SPOR domain-containing protein [Thermoanaerobaculia bacterium]|nr:SPOR domain-containing protein [Thermoanaerobaculia bacterium]
MAGLGLDDRPEEAQSAAPVHYQISITGRQAGFFFMALLAALGLSFFFGMKTGAAARKGPGGAAAIIASASDIPVPTLAPAEGLREEKKPDDALGIKPEEKKAAAAEEREARETRDAKKAADPAPAPAPAAAPPTPAPTAAPTPAPKPTAKPAPKPAPKGPFYVQVLATKDAARADELAKRLRSEGFSADVAAIPAKPGWFRVHVGPIKDRAKAEALAKKIKASDKQIKNVPLVVP